MRELDDAVHELTRDHAVWITRDSGKKEAAQEESLLKELRSLLQGESRGVGDTGGGGGVPLSLSAVDLWQEIAKTTETFWPGRGRAALRRTPLGEKIQSWAKATENNPESRAECLRFVGSWCERIKAMRVRKSTLDAPCPQCGHRWVMEDDEDGGGGVVYRAALVYDSSGACCRVCLFEWPGQEMLVLAGQINAAV